VITTTKHAEVKKETGDWKLFRERFGLARTDEVDLHFSRRDPLTPYWEAMDELHEFVMNMVKRAQQNGRPYLMFVHGWSTSRPGQMTARSVVRVHAITGRNSIHRASKMYSA
jgi:hypothetical protein